MSHRAYLEARRSDGLPGLLTMEEEHACVDACSVPCVSANLKRKVWGLWRARGTGLKDAPTLRPDEERDEALASALKGR